MALSNQEIETKILKIFKEKRITKKIPQSSMDEMIESIKDGMDIHDVIRDTMYFIDSMKGKVRFDF
jgi:hypothetical protein